MNKKVILNGIELSLPKYDAKAATLFDYLEDIVSDLQEELSEDDGNFEISIQMDFSTNSPPRHQILSGGRTKKATKDKVVKVLNTTKSKNSSTVSGSVKVNLQVEDG